MSGKQTTQVGPTSTAVIPKDRTSGPVRQSGSSASSITGEADDPGEAGSSNTRPRIELQLAHETGPIRDAEQNREEGAHLEERQSTSRRDSPISSTGRGRQISDEFPGLPEAERLQRAEDWKAFHGKRIAEVRATEAHLHSLRSEAEVEMASLARLKEERRREEARIEQARRERVDREWAERHADEKRRAYEDELLRLENRRKEILRQPMLERGRHSPRSPNRSSRNSSAAGRPNFTAEQLGNMIR